MFYTERKKFKSDEKNEISEDKRDALISFYKVHQKSEIRESFRLKYLFHQITFHHFHKFFLKYFL